MPRRPLAAPRLPGSCLGLGGRGVRPQEPRARSGDIHCASRYLQGCPRPEEKEARARCPVVGQTLTPLLPIIFFHVPSLLGVWLLYSSVLAYIKCLKDWSRLCKFGFPGDQSSRFGSRPTHLARGFPRQLSGRTDGCSGPAECASLKSARPKCTLV